MCQSAHNTATLVPPQPGADSSVSHNSRVQYNVEKETKRSLMKILNNAAFSSYCKNSAVVHKAKKKKSCPNLPFAGEQLNDTRHKFYRIQIPFCGFLSELNVLNVCWQLFSYLEVQANRHLSLFSHGARLSIICSSIGLPSLPLPPTPTLLSCVVSKPDTWAFALLLWKYDSFSFLQIN